MHLDRAHEVLAAERRKLLAERDAFAAFESRISDLASDATRGTGVLERSLLVESTDSTGIDRVRQAYEATVMSVEHFDEYGDPFERHVQTEFGPECAQALCAERDFTPQLKQALLNASAEARERRTALATTIEEEADVVEQVERFVEEVRPVPTVSGDESFDRLCELREALCAHGARGESLLAERQGSLHQSWAGVSRQNHIDPKSFNEYLYEPLPVTYPVLDALTRVLADLRSARESVDAHISTYRG